VDEDDILMTRLREAFAGDRPPPATVELVKQMFGLRTVEAELAALIADSDVEPGAVAVRGDAQATRLLTFESAGLAIEIEVTAAGRDRRVLGQLVPPGPATIEARQPSEQEPRVTEADASGRFVLDGLRSEPLSLTVHRAGSRVVTTEWIGVT
jgi:hypothetical protein